MVKIGKYELGNNNECEKLIGVGLVWKLSFDYRISDICKKLPLMWTCYSRTNNRKIHGPLKTCLNIIHRL